MTVVDSTISCKIAHLGALLERSTRATPPAGDDREPCPCPPRGVDADPGDRLGKPKSGVSRVEIPPDYGAPAARVGEAKSRGPRVLENGPIGLSTLSDAAGIVARGHAVPGVQART